MSVKKQCITSPRSKKTTNDSLITIVFLCDSPGYRMKSYGAIPLIPFKTKRLIDICEERGDALAIIDPRGGYTPNTENTLSEQNRTSTTAA